MRTNAGLVLMAVLLIAASPASARKAHLRTLYSFCSQSGCADGREPSAGVTKDPSGNLFGTTLFGGDHGVGVVYELIPNARKTKWKYKRLYSFCAQSNCADGSDPEAALILDSSGSLYGVTMAGGASDGGVAYKLMPNAKHTKWSFSVLYSFCAQADCVDGREPQAALTYAGEESGIPYDGASPLYGTASQAGANKQGVAFKLTPGANWTEQVLYSFCSQSDCADGANPVAALTVGPSGDLFGTTFGGGMKGKNCTDIGVGGCGTAFKLTWQGGAWQETVLHAFCAKKTCNDGGYPLAGLLVGSSGKLYGASLYGGGGTSPGNGTIFEADGSEQALYRFCTEGECLNGAAPEGDLIMDASGALFGTTLFAGANGDGGTIFELIP